MRFNSLSPWGCWFKLGLWHYWKWPQTSSHVAVNVQGSVTLVQFLVDMQWWNWSPDCICWSPFRDKDCRTMSSLDFLPVACSGQGYAVRMGDVFPWASPWLSWFQVCCRHAALSSLWSCWGLASQQQWVNAKTLDAWPILLLSCCALELLFTFVLANLLVNTLGSCLWGCTSVKPWSCPLWLNALKGEKKFSSFQFCFITRKN